MTAEAPGDPEQPRRRRRRLRWVVLAAVAVVGAWAAVVAVSLVRARSEAEAGLASVRRAEKLTSPADLVDGRPLPYLRDAETAFDRAHGRLDGPLLAPLRVLPVVGRQVRSAASLAGAAGEVSDVGADAVAAARAALQRPHATGPERLALLRELGRVAGDADRRLARVRLGPSRALFGTLAEKRAEVADRLADIRRGLADGAVVATGLADVLQGPRRYLVVAANNSEMRAGSGMFLSVGELTFADGSFALGALGPSADLAVPSPPPITDADYAARWGWLNPNREWRNLAVSPRFDATAELASRMWSALGRAPVDGVIALDPIAVQAIMEATGPADVGGRRIEPAAVDDFLLHDQYAGITTLEGVAQAGRRELLGVIAQATLAKVEQGGWDTAKLAAGLARAARGRHLLAWAARPEEQRMWEGAGIDGGVPRSSLLVSVLNRGGNKLDRFLRVDADLSLRPDQGGTAAELRVTLANTTPAGESVYVAGPYPGSGVGAGDYVGILSVNVPGHAGALEADGGTAAAAGPDGATHVLAVPVRIDRGQEKTVTFRFRFADPSGSLVVLPSARVPAVSWTVPGQQWNENASRRVEW